MRRLTRISSCFKFALIAGQCGLLKNLSGMQYNHYLFSPYLEQIVNASHDADCSSMGVG